MTERFACTTTGTLRPGGGRWFRSSSSRCIQLFSGREGSDDPRNRNSIAFLHSLGQKRTLRNGQNEHNPENTHSAPTGQWCAPSAGRRATAASTTSAFTANDGYGGILEDDAQKSRVAVPITVLGLFSRFLLAIVGTQRSENDSGA